MVTQKRLKELLHYDPDNGVFTWLVSCSPRTKVGDVAGGIDNGYQKIGIDGVSYRSHRLAWLYEYGYFPENDLDHIDRNRGHNWINNLREVSQVCNQRNTGNHKDNTSGVKGVHWSKARSKWQTQIVVNGNKINLGAYNELLEAVCHRLAAEQAEGWEGCDSSSPAYQFVKLII